MLLVVMVVMEELLCGVLRFSGAVQGWDAVVSQDCVLQFVAPPLTTTCGLAWVAAVLLLLVLHAGAGVEGAVG